MNTISVRPVFWAWVLAGLAVLVFSNTISDSFVWDDEQFIYRNAYVAEPGHWVELLTANVVAGAGLVSNLYRPVQSLTHRLDVMLFGFYVEGHHLSNVLFHAAAAAAIYLLFRTLFLPATAFIVAAFFALHPIQTEAVAYVSGRGDTLAILCTALGLLLFEKRRVFSLLAAALAMLSKESHALFPVFLVLFVFGRKQPIRMKDHAPYWVLSAGYAALRLTVLNFKNTLNFYSEPNILTQEPLSRVWTYCTTAPKGMLLWLWPADLHHERSWPVFTSPFVAPVLCGGAVILLSLFLAWRFRRKNPIVSAGILWFYAATFPTSNLVVLINAIFYDHWFILPGVGLCMVLGAVVDGICRGVRPYASTKIIAGVVLAACLVLLAATTVRYNAVWRTPVSLYSYILDREPNSAKMSTNLGMVLADSGQMEKSVEYYKRSIAISDEYPQTHHNLGMAYRALNREEDAEREYLKAVEMDPRFFHSWLYLGLIAVNRGDYAAAREYFRRVLEIYPYSRLAKKWLAQIDRMS